MNITNIILLISAMCTALLAIMAFCSIRQTARALVEDKNNRQIEKSPIFHIEEQSLGTDSGTSSVTELEVEIKNIGFGPAFNIFLECSQGTSKFSVLPRIDEETPTEGILTELPLHLVIGAKGKWICCLGNNVKKENALEPLVLTVSGESIFRNRVKQEFVWKPIEKLGGITQDARSRFSSIDFGMPEAKRIKWFRCVRNLRRSVNEL